MTDPRMTTTDAPVTVEQGRQAYLRCIGKAISASDTTVASAAYDEGWKDGQRALASAPAGDGVDLQVVGDACRYAKDVLVQVFEGRGRKMTGTAASNVNVAAHRLGDALAALARPRAAVGERDDIAAAIEEMTRAEWDAWVVEASGSRMHNASVAATYRKADRILDLQSPPAKVG